MFDVDKREEYLYKRISAACNTGYANKPNLDPPKGSSSFSGRGIRPLDWTCSSFAY